MVAEWIKEQIESSSVKDEEGTKQKQSNRQNRDKELDNPEICKSDQNFQSST